MRYPWAVSLVLSCALVAAGAGGAGVDGGATATTRAPPRTLDRQNYELAWRAWLQSPESGSQNSPPRRITTKSLFITPLVCPKGQRLDRNGCIQVVTVNKDEHERILLEQLNALFTSAPSRDVVYDYGDDEPGPFQLSIPIALDPRPQASALALQAQEPSAQAEDLLPNFVKVDKKDENKTNADASIEAELELLKLQQSPSGRNDTAASDKTDVLNHDVLDNLMPPVDKPKRDSQVVNKTDVATNDNDEGQKELVFGDVNIDPYVYNTESQTTTETTTEEPTTTPPPTPVTDRNYDKVVKTKDNLNQSSTEVVDKSNTITSITHELKKDGEQSKLNPEHDYADLGEAIKLISRYAEVTTDDNFSKDRKKYAFKDDSILGTRTKLQYRRNKPKTDIEQLPPVYVPKYENKENMPMQVPYAKSAPYYRYPWPGQHSPTPPPDYPFHHLQDYWPGWNQIGGVYNTGHENPRRHHHNYPHNYYRLRGTYAKLAETFPKMQQAYAGQHGYPPRVPDNPGTPLQSHPNNQDLYSLLGLKHWFSSEGTSKR